MHSRTLGLYKDAYERDSCGFGLIASLDDAPSHWLVQTAMSLAQPPHAPRRHRRGRQDRGRLRAAAEEAGEVPARGGRRGGHHARAALCLRAGVPLDRARRRRARARDARRAQLTRQGLGLAGWRVVPTEPDACGAEAVKSLPRIEQLFVNCRAAVPDEAAFNRRLYMARRLAEKALEADAHVLRAEPVGEHHRLQGHGDAAATWRSSTPTSPMSGSRASVAVFHQRFSTNTLPQWRLAHPYRYLAHNGEINTVQGNRNWARARGPLLNSPLLPDLGDGAAAGVAHRLGLAEPGQHARGAAHGRPRPAACHAPADPAGLARTSTRSIRTCARSTSTTRCTWSPGTGRPAWC